MFQEIKCTTFKKKIRVPQRDEHWLQVIKDLGMKYLQRAWKTLILTDQKVGNIKISMKQVYRKLKKYYITWKG